MSAGATYIQLQASIVATDEAYNQAGGTSDAWVRSLYVNILGLTVGQRPPFSFGGIWLYAGGKPILHISEDELPKNRAGVISFVMDAAHPHDLTTFADRYGLAMRGGHHCNQPLMKRFGLPGTTRASFYLYNTRDEVDRMIEILEKAIAFFK